MESLFDYLGHAAGNELGKKVAEYAKIRKAKYGIKNVENKAYKGIVLMYEHDFIKEFFEVQNLFKGKQEDYTEINAVLIEDSFKQHSDEGLVY
jgi:hypothetical protein